MKRILAATDFSTRSQRAVRRAARLARQTGAELTLLHIVDEEPEHLVSLEKSESRKILEEQIASIDELRDAGLPVGALGITTFRPFPVDAVRAALRAGQRVVALERAFAVGGGGIMAQDLREALAGLDCPLSTVVAGLGGRSRTLSAAQHDELALDVEAYDRVWMVFATVGSMADASRFQRTIGPAERGEALEMPAGSPDRDAEE